MSLKPVYCKHKDLCDRKDKIDPYEICDAAAKSIGEDNVVGAQPLENLWKIYARNAESRTSLLSKGINVRGRYITLYDSNPEDTNIEYLPTEKVIFRDLPLEMDNTEIANYLSAMNVETTSEVKYGNVMLPTGKWSTYRNGDRYVYCRSPLHPVLPYVTYIGGYRCRISHQTQRDICKSCRHLGHKWGDPVCPAYLEEESKHHPFRGYRNPLSNMFPCIIPYKGKRFRTVEHAFQWAKATALGEHNIAEQIYRAKHGGAAKGIADKRLSHDKSQEWSVSTDALDVMKDLLDIKAKKSGRFFRELHSTGSANIVEATSDQYWACGIPNPKVAAATAKDFWQGSNILGALLMDLREQTIDDYEMLTKHGCDYNGYGGGLSYYQDNYEDNKDMDHQSDVIVNGNSSMVTELELNSEAAFPTLGSKSNNVSLPETERIPTPTTSNSDSAPDPTSGKNETVETELSQNTPPEQPPPTLEQTKHIVPKKHSKIKVLSRGIPSSQPKINAFVSARGKRKCFKTPPHGKDSKQRHVDDTDTDWCSEGTDEFHDTQSDGEIDT